MGAVLAVVAYQGVRLALELREVRHDVSALKGTLVRRDLTAARAASARLRRDGAASHRRADGITFRALGAVPVVGRDVRALRTFLDVLDDANREVVPPTLELAEQTSGDSLRASDGRFDVRRIRALQPQVVRLSDSVTALQRRADTVPARHLLLPPVRRAVLQAQDQVDDLAAASRSAAVAVRVLPTMMGGGRPRHYLLIVQNNAEIRSSGGLVGTVARLTVDHGRISLGGQISDARFPILHRPVLPLTTEEETVYGPVMGEDLRDTNLTPDFRRTGELVHAMFQRRFGQDADGVISVDPVALSMVLRATGSVTADHETFTADNVVDKFLHSVYQRYRDPREQDAYFARSSTFIFAGVAGGQGDERALLLAVGKAVQQRRLLVWSRHPQEQRQLEQTKVAGALDPPGASGPDALVTLNDGTVGKMQYFLRYDSAVRSVSCAARTQTLKVGVRLRSTAPPGGRGLVPYVRGYGTYAPIGSMRMNVRFYSPVGGRVLGIRANGQSVRIARATQQGRDVALVVDYLAPQQTTDFEVTLRGRKGDVGDPLLRWTPSIVDAPTQATAPTSCG